MIEILSRWSGAVLFRSETAPDMRAAVLEAVRSGANLTSADLYGANLRGADLYGADLTGADLTGANLRGADLYGADLTGANLYGANLRGANLPGANLPGANLTGANLYGANLRGANLSGANLYGANLTGAKGVTPKVLQILGSRHPIIVRSFGRVSIGCMDKPIVWWEAQYPAVGRAEGYSEAEIEEYAGHIAACRKFMELHSLLVEPAAEGVAA